MLSKRDVGIRKITPDDFELILGKIMSDVRESEKEIVKKSKSISDEMITTYNNRINAVVKLLRAISTHAFIHTWVEKVRLYKPSEDMPAPYIEYLNLSTNLIDLILVDIFSQKSTDLKLMTMERWIAIGRLCLSQNDIFTAEKIIVGIGCHYLITKSHLMDWAMEDSKNFTEKYSLYFARHHNVNSLHHKLHSEKKACIPLLPSLSHVLETQNEWDADKPEEQKELSRSDSRSMYSDMQTRVQFSKKYVSISIEEFDLYKRLIKGTDDNTRYDLHQSYEKSAKKIQKEEPSKSLLEVLPTLNLGVQATRLSKRFPMLFENNSPRTTDAPSVSSISMTPIRLSKKD